MDYIELLELEELGDGQGRFFSPSNFIKLKAAWHFLNPTFDEVDSLANEKELKEIS